MKIENLFDTHGLGCDAEVAQELLSLRDVRLERIVSFGHPTAPGEWYDQQQAEWVALVRGEAKLLYKDGRLMEMRAGDTLFIPPHEEHRVEWVSLDAVWLALFVSV